MAVGQIEFFFVGIPAEVRTIIVGVNIEFLVVRVITVSKLFLKKLFIVRIDFFGFIFVGVSGFWTRISEC
jgi:hypothetical protein